MKISETWPAIALRDNAGRVIPMGSGMAMLGASLALDSDAKSIAAMVVGGTLIIGGYLSTSIKKMIWKLPGGGLEIETRDREERTEIDVATTQEIESGDIEVEPSDATQTFRFLAASLTLESVLRDLEGSVLEHCRLHLYLYDEDAGGLVAQARFEPVGSSVTADKPWPVDEGVTGMAYTTGQMQVAWGPQTHDGTFNLSPERQERHADLRAVAASPILNNAGRTIGVLSASDPVGPPEESVLLTDDGADELIVRAMVTARVLVDLLGWFPDDE